jgi:hypothetical protein
VIEAATVVNHRVYIRVLALFYDHTNLVSSLADCHDVDEKRIEREGEARAPLDAYGWPSNKKIF